LIVPLETSTYLSILIPGLVGAVFMARVLHQLHRSLALGALIGAFAGGLGSMLFMVPLSYCTFDDGRAFIDHFFGGMLVITGAAMALLFTRWAVRVAFSKGGWGTLMAGQSSMGTFKGRLTPWLLLLPSLVILALFLYYPALDTFRLSVLLARLGTSRTAFVCLDNFTRLTDPSGFTLSTLGLMLIPIAGFLAIRWIQRQDIWSGFRTNAIGAVIGLIALAVLVDGLGTWVLGVAAIMVVMTLQDETSRRPLLVYTVMSAAFVFFFTHILSEVLTSSYYRVVASTFVISLATVIIGLILALGIAYMAYQPIRGATIYRTLLIWPYAISPPVAGIIFWLIFNPNAGIVNHVIVNLGGERLPWLQSATLAPWTIIIASVWKSMGFNILFYIAGLQNIPNDLVEAAAIDGANAWQRFTNIIIPSLSPITFFLIITNITYAFFDIFGTIDYMTRGGPAGATTVMIYDIYRVGIQQVDLGKGAAQSIVLFALVIGITYIQFRTSGRRVSYGA
jgi:sn-glycerol 3-phosphate transport system permease protein